jgi:hypothetical protein
LVGCQEHWRNHKQAKIGREPFEYAVRLSHGSQGGLKMLADKMARQWAGIERAMNLANHNPAFRPQVESLVNTYFALIDEMAAELERRRVTRTVSLEDWKWGADRRPGTAPPRRYWIVFGPLIVVLELSIICFIKSIAACGVGWLNGVAMYSGAGSNGFLASANHCPDQSWYARIRKSL